MPRFRFGVCFVMLAGITVACLAGVRSAATPVAFTHHITSQRPEVETPPEDEFLFQRLSHQTQLDPNAFAIAGKEALAVRASTATHDAADASAVWSFDGPTHIGNPGNDGGGRVPDVAVDPNPADTVNGHSPVYAATAGGGVWKTTDGGKTFTSVWPSALPQAVGAIAVAKDGTVWAGTGETNPGGGSITFFGDGIYRSTDGGASWSNVGLTDSWTIARIVVNPTNPNQVWVAVSGNLFLTGHQRGVYVSNNAENTTPAWTQSLAPANGTTGAADLAMSQQDTKVIYATMWDHVRVPDHRTYTGVGSGVWKTTDGGTTWTDLTASANTANDHLLADGNPDIGRIGVAVAPSDDHTVYVNYANDANGVQEPFFASTDGGATFTPSSGISGLLTAPEQSAFVYGWWFARTYVDPQDPKHVFVTGLCMWESTDGAGTFHNDCNGGLDTLGTNLNSVHADQHAMAWDPNDPTHHRVYAGDDGGFYTSVQNGALGSFTPASNEPWPQFGGLDVSEQDPTRIIGGLQDNGTQRNWDNSGHTVGFDQWNSINGGDGQRAVIDPANQNIVYSCSQYGNCTVSTDGGNCATPTACNQFGGSGDGTPLGCTNCAVTTRNAYFTPITLDPSNPATVYIAGDMVNVSHDNGGSWTLISPPLGGASPGTETDPVYAGHYGVVTTISVSKTNPDVVWVGTDSGSTWMTSNASSTPAMPTWTQISGLSATNQQVGTLPVRWVSKVYVDPSNAQIVYVAFSGYRSGDNNAYIERSNDGGATWTDLSGGLPEATVNDAVLAGGRLYLATDTGVYASDAAQNPETAASITWRQIGSNLPNLAVTALRFIPENNTMYVSTFGRGVWSLSLGPAVETPEAGPVVLLPLLGVAAIGGVAGVRLRRRKLIYATSRRSSSS